MPSTKVVSNSKSIRMNADGKGFTVNGSPFHVDEKYEPIDAIGQGSYGVVCSARNKLTGEKVAIKKIKPMAGDEWDATHTLREIRLMRCLGEHENIISLKDLSIHEENDELYMMMELVDTDLHRLIQSSTKLTESHIRVIMYQLLSAVEIMHSNGILHRDLKPGNLLINKDCELKVTDFGFARMMPKLSSSTEDTTKPYSPMTEYVVTRWYRSPELMLAPNGRYDGAIDMWSCGCILGELLNRRPLFPGNDFMEQLTRVFKLVPIPSKEKRSYTVEKDALHFLESVVPASADAFEKAFKTATPDGLDLLKKLLCFNPCERLSASKALQHSFFKGIESEWGKIPRIHLKEPLAFTFENQTMTLAALKQLIHEEVKLFQTKPTTSISSVDNNKDTIATTVTKKQKPEENPETEDNSNNTSAAVSVSSTKVQGFQIKGCFFHVDAKYEPLQVLGEGTYGVVCCVKDKDTNQKLAIKKITPMASDAWDAKHTLREVRLMRYFGSHPNITGLRNLSAYGDELYLMMDIADTDLHRLIQSKTVLTSRHIEAILYQILCGVKALHENNVLHRDLKPGNILVSRNCDVKIADFGLSRVALHPSTETTTSTMTEYVVTRWYRPPEIMLAPNGHYTSAVDMWSIGCIFGELLSRRPLFPGNDFIDQIMKIFTVLPLPEDLSYTIESDAATFLSALPKCSKNTLAHVFPTISENAFDLLSKLLTIDPTKRITASQALLHPFFQQVRQDLRTPMNFQVDAKFNLNFDIEELTLENLKHLILDEITYFNQEKEMKTVLPTSADMVVSTSTTTTAPTIPAVPVTTTTTIIPSSLESESVIERAENILSKYDETRYKTNSTISSTDDMEEETMKQPTQKTTSRTSWTTGRNSLKNTVNEITNSVLKLLSKKENSMECEKSSETSLTENSLSETEIVVEHKPNTKSHKLPKKIVQNQWEKKIDPKTGRLYYLNVLTQKMYTKIPESIKI